MICSYLCDVRDKIARAVSDNWLSISGDGIEPGETPAQAVVREMKEELGVEVDVKSLLAVQDVPSDESHKKMSEIDN